MPWITKDACSQANDSIPLLRIARKAKPWVLPGQRSHIFRLQPYCYRELQRLAKERRWFSSTYLASLTVAHIEARPVSCEAEINALRQVARQPASLGRNFNQIARKLDSPRDEAHHAMGMDLELV